MHNLTVYENLRDDEGKPVDGRIRLFLKDSDIDAEGNIKTFKAGTASAINETGKVYIIDDYIINQIDKVKVENDTLKVKEGMEIDVPEKTPEEIEREQLLARLAELDGA